MKMIFFLKKKKVLVELNAFPFLPINNFFFLLRQEKETHFLTFWRCCRLRAESDVERAQKGGGGNGKKREILCQYVLYSEICRKKLMLLIPHTKALGLFLVRIHMSFHLYRLTSKCNVEVVVFARLFWRGGGAF